VRLQSQTGYRGPLDCFRQSLQAEGVRGLYRGISAPLVGAALETGSLFFFERLGRETLHRTGLVPRLEDAGGQPLPLPLPALWLTGAFSGVFTSFVLTPVELVKCKIQVAATTATAPATNAVNTAAAITNKATIPPLRTQILASTGTTAAAAAAAAKPLAVVRDIYRHHGLLGFWHGQTGTLIREAGGCAAWFGTKETASKLLRRWHHGTAASTSGVESQSPLPLWQQAVAGASAGVAYNFLFFPADTIKSRMQTRPIAEGTGGQTFWSESRALWRLAGIKGFYRGCGITVLRSAPSSAFIFMVYDGLKQNLRLA